MALRASLSLKDYMQCALTKGWLATSSMTQSRFVGTRPRPSDNVKIKKQVRPPLLTTSDGIMRQPGMLINERRTVDGKPVFPGRMKWTQLRPGTVVRAGMTLLMQKKLNFHPGLYVGLGRDLTLYAYEDGVVYITWEKVNCNWDNWIAKEFYFDEKDNDIYMPHYHVIPEPQRRMFKLVSQI